MSKMLNSEYNGDPSQIHSPRTGWTKARPEAKFLPPTCPHRTPFWCLGVYDNEQCGSRPTR